MINLTQDSSQYVDLSLSELITITDPYFIFKWVDKYSNEEIDTYEDLSEYPDRYNRFLIEDSSNFHLKYSGTYEVYESVVDSSIIDSSMNLLESGQYTYHKLSTGYVVYDPSYAVVDGYKVYDPYYSVKSDGTYFQDPSLVEIYILLDTSLAEITKGYVDGSLAERDASIIDLYTKLEDASISDVNKLYVDGSLAERDASIIDLYTKLEDASISDVNKLYVDGSLAERDASIIDLYDKIPIVDVTKSYVDGSLAKRDSSIDFLFAKNSQYDISLNNLGSVYVSNASLGTSFIWAAGVLDVSVEGGTSAQDPSIIDLYDFVEDLSSYSYNKNVSQDASILGIDGSINALFAAGAIGALKEASLGDDFLWNAGYLDISTLDAEELIYSKEYIDGSLNNSIKEASLGTDFVWNAGVLDVSILPIDPSISDLYNLTTNLESGKVEWHNATALPRHGNIWKETSLGSISDEYYQITCSNDPSYSYFCFGYSWSFDYLPLFLLRGRKPTIILANEDDPSNYVRTMRSDSDSYVDKTYYSKNYIDGSLSGRDISINNLKIKNDSQDASIVSLQSNITTLTNKNTSQDASIVSLQSNITTLTNKNTSQDASIVSLQNTKQDIITDGTFLKESSIGSGLSWNAGVLDVSIEGGSISQDASIVDLYSTKLGINDASENYAKRLTSFAIKDVSYLATISDNNNIIFADTSAMSVIFPNTLPVGFQTTVVNRTSGVVTLNASTYFSTDSSVRLRDRYAAASIVCSSVGTYYFFGNLK